MHSKKIIKLAISSINDKNDIAKVIINIIIKINKFLIYEYNFLDIKNIIK